MDKKQENKNNNGRTENVSTKERSRSSRNNRNSRSNRDRNRNTNADCKTESNNKSVAESTMNDPSWYSMGAQIDKDVASIPFNRFTGTKLPSLNQQPFADGIIVADESDRSWPGVLAIDYIPAYPSNEGAASAINVTATALYSWVRHQNSGRTNYEKSDLMIYILAMAELYDAIFWAKRIYRLAMTYDVQNRYIPDMLIRADHVDPENIRANLAQFRYGINLRIAKISSLAVPKEYDLFKRRALLSTAVVVDSDAITSQFYLFHRKGFYKFDPTMTNGGGLTFIAEQENLCQYTDILNKIDELLNVVLSDEDSNIMSGDILKAYGRENLYSIPELNELETQEFGFDMDLLAQIENSTAVTVNIGADANVVQNNNEISAIYTARNGSSFSTYKTARANVNFAILSQSELVFNSHISSYPTPGQVLEWTRLRSVIMNGQIKSGTEIVTGYRFLRWNYNSVSDPTVTELAVDTALCLDYSSKDTADNNDVVAKALQMASIFDWHPILQLFGVVTASANSSATYFGVIGDLKHPTLLSSTSLLNLHDVALIGLFKAHLLRISG